MLCGTGALRSKLELRAQAAWDAHCGGRFLNERAEHKCPFHPHPHPPPTPSTHTTTLFRRFVAQVELDEVVVSTSTNVIFAVGPISSRGQPLQHYSEGDADLALV